MCYVVVTNLRVYGVYPFSNFLVNSADRIVRVYDVDDIVHNADSGSEPEALQKLQDLVNKYVCILCDRVFSDPWLLTYILTRGVQLLTFQNLRPKCLP